MTSLITFTVILLMGLVSSGPVSDLLTINKDFYADELVICSAEHDIVNLFVPLNSLNFGENDELKTFNDDNLYIFFVEAEENELHEVGYKGLYVLKNKKATKLLDNGRDFAATCDESKQVFLAATDGIYTFNAEENKAEKYGSLTDSLIGIAVSNASDFLYVLSEDNVLYKVTDNGNAKEEVTDVKEAVQIILDNSNNLFFVNRLKQVYIKSIEDGTVKKVRGLPAQPTYAKLQRPPMALEEGLPYIAGKKVFITYPNATSEFTEIYFTNRPTAIATEATLLLYFAYDHKIYEYNILALIMGTLDVEELEELKMFLDDRSDDIKQMGSKCKKAILGH